MADKKISELTAATTVNDGDQLPLVQSGSTLSLDASVLRAYVTADSTLVKVDVNQVLSVANSITERGHYSKGAFSGTYTDGIVLDYVTGTGRISVGSSDGLSIYNGGVGGTALLNLDSAGNLGLGVVPSGWSNFKAFDIQGYGAIASYTAGGGIYAGVGLYANTYYNGANYIYKSANYAMAYDMGANGFRWYTAPSGTAGTAISFTTAMTLNASGYLGVGTTSPGQKLEVAGSAYFTGGVAGQGAYVLRNGADGGGVYSSQIGSVQLSTASTDPITFVTNSSEKMRLTSAGYLGIGTSSPSYVLDVNGPASGISLNLRNATGSVVRLGLGYVSSAPIDNITQAQVLANGSGDLLLSSRTDFASGISFFTNSGSAATQRMRLDSSGNLGLGVTPSAWTPTYRKAIQLGTYSTLSNDNYYALTDLSNNVYESATGVYRYIASDGAAMFRLQAGAFKWFFAPSGTAGNAISFTQAMTLNASGQLLVGATSASSAEQLHVEGVAPNVIIRNPGASAYTSLRLYNDQNSATRALEIDYFGSTYSGGELALIATTGAYPLTFATNNTERARIDSSGNLGLGVTPSGWSLGKAFEIGNAGNGFLNNGSNTLFTTSNAYYNGGWKYGGAGTATQYSQNGGVHSWLTAVSGTAGNAISFTQAMTLFPSGGLSLGNTTDLGAKTINVGITASTTNTLVGAINFQGYTSTYGAGIASYIPSGAPGIDWQDLRFYISQGPAAINVERMRLDTSGNLLVGTTSASNGASTFSTSANSVRFAFLNTNNAGGNYGLIVTYQNSTPNGTGNEFLVCNDPGATRAAIRSNGGLANYSANNVNLSDERVKTDITPATSWLAKINEIEVVNFKYKDQTHDDFNLGVIAQQVQSVAPELVDTDGFGETPENGIPLMAIYETDLKYAMLKAIQELHAELQALKATLH